MLGEKHDLIHELPEYKDRIHELKLGNNYFAKLFSKYHEIDHAIKRIEEGVESTADDYLGALKKDRLHLKDELLSMIKTA